jgi:enoyl-CoA hydratase
MEPLVLLEKDAGIATVTLNRPDAMNALSLGLRRAFVEVFEGLAAANDTAVVILTGAGRAFCAGVDLKELGGEIETAETASETVRDQGIAECLAHFPLPIIGAVNGYAITGGFELALMCDIVICSSDASFADTHARVGLMPGWGISQRLPRLIGINRAKELSLSGNFLKAEQAYAWGLVNRVVAPADLLSACKALATDIASTDPVTRGELKRIMDEGWDTTLEAGLAIEAEASRNFAESGVNKAEIAERTLEVQARARKQ